MTTDSSQVTAHNSKTKSSNIKDRSYNFSLEIIKFVNGFPEKQVFKVIGNQLLRSATSIGANLIEAKASGSKKEFIRYYQISLKSGDESQYWLSLLKDSYKNLSPRCDVLMGELKEICRMLASSIITLKR